MSEKVTKIELSPLPPYDYYVTLANADDYGCWSRETMRSYALAAIEADRNKRSAAPVDDLGGMMPKDMSEAKRLIVQLRGALADTRSALSMQAKQEPEIRCANHPDVHFDLVVSGNEVSCIDCGDSWPIVAAPVQQAEQKEGEK